MKQNENALAGQVWILGRPAAFLTDSPQDVSHKSILSDGSSVSWVDRNGNQIRFPMSWELNASNPHAGYYRLPAGTVVEIVTTSAPFARDPGGEAMATMAIFWVHGAKDARRALFSAPLHLADHAQHVVPAPETVLDAATPLPAESAQWSAKVFDELQQALPALDLQRIAGRPAN